MTLEPRSKTPLACLRLLFGATVLATAVVGAAACNTGGTPQATGTKTDWLVSCDTEADCDATPELSCLCGVCTTTCSTDTDCGRGVCGSEITTKAICGSDAPPVAAGEQICVPEASDTANECLVALIPQESQLGETQPLTCATEDALLCEDFDGLLSEAYSTWGDGESTAGLTECQSAQGNGSLRIDAIDGGYTQTRMRLLSPVSGGELHARLFLRVDEASTFPDQLIFLEFWDQDEGMVDDRTTVYLNQDQVLEIYLGGPNLTLQASTPVPFDLGAWHCLELGMSLDDSAGTVSLSVDGASVVEATDVDTLPSDPISVAVLEGVPTVGSQDTHVTLYLDDLVVGTAPIGCN